MKTSLDGLRDVKVYQNMDGYRFSVDALLLYSFVNMKYVKAIADLGAGSGIIGLLLAKKYPDATVLLAELQESLYRLVEKNIRINGLEERVSALLADINDIGSACPAASCDLVVSNPPFRKPLSGRLSLGQERAVARHELRLRLPALAKAASHLLRAKGRFCMIFHPERLVEVIDALREVKLEPKRIRFAHNDAGAVSKIVLVEAVKGARPGLKVEKPLILYGADGSYTDELRGMYGEG
ncbi:MAG: tRNA1(Val) (adenine(37)-N6)-methyltransferase [Nitrospiraceae bacterium]|nr:tRNA1(Val) (adenine(37)-N6)-methyltransferase [Nitrospiraceae bacterium]